MEINKKFRSHSYSVSTDPSTQTSNPYALSNSPKIATTIQAVVVI